MRATELRGLACGVLLLGTAQAWACGYCVEDKIAATYDHAVAMQAFARKHDVVFLHVEGQLPGGEAGRKLIADAALAAGADRGTVRVSPDNLTLAFAYDPAKANVAVLQGRIEKRLASRKVELLPLRILDRPGDFKVVKR